MDLSIKKVNNPAYNTDNKVKKLPAMRDRLSRFLRGLCHQTGTLPSYTATPDSHFVRPGQALRNATGKLRRDNYRTSCCVYPAYRQAGTTLVNLIGLYTWPSFAKASEGGDCKNTCLPAGRRAVLHKLRPHKHDQEYRGQCLPASMPAGRQAFAQQRFLTLLPGRCA